MSDAPGDQADARFERLFLAYQQPILNYLYRLVGDLPRAEDMAQETFVKAYRALARLPGDANERAWLYRIATNCAHDWHRRCRLIRWLPLLDSDVDCRRRDEAKDVIEAEAVQGALAQLPASYREPLILFSMQGFSTTEIGLILGLTPGAVKVRLHRAREMFRTHYNGDNG